MKFLSKTIGIFVILLSFTAIFTACKSSSDDDPEAQVPRITSISADVTTVVNIAKELTVGVEVSDSGKLSYQWYVSDSKLSKGAPEENGNAASFLPKTTNAGIFYYYCEIKNTLDSSVRSAISPIITYKVTDCINAQAPALVQQPEDVTASFGDSFSLSTFSYSTDGGTLSYQWFYAADKDKDATSIQEATKATYTGAISAGSLGYYYCVITNTIPDNGDGGEKIASTKTKTVKLSSTQIFAKAPVILQQPQNLKLDFGNDFKFSVAAYSSDNGTLSYQWYYKATENDEAVAINDATTQTYTGTVSAKTIGYYYCLIENTISDNGDGGTKNTVLQTNTARLSNDTIEANKPVILTQPQGATLHVSEKTLLSVSAYSVDKGKLTYQWHKITGETDEAIENATKSSYEVIANKVGTTKYYCIVTNTISDNGDGGLKSAAKETNTITITVDYTNANKPVITTQPDDVSAVIPAIKVFQIGAYTEDDGVLTYQWYSVAEGETEGTPITGENKSKLIVNVKELGKTGYYCVVTNTIPDNGDGSGKKQTSVKSETAWLDAIYLKEVISAPVFTDQPEKVNIVPYNQSIKLTCKAKAAEGSVSYRWYESPDGTTDKGVAVSNATSSTFTTPKYTERGIYYYYCVATNVLAESEENIKSACAISDVVSVAYTGLPTVYVNTGDTATSEITKEAYVLGKMEIISEEYGNFSYNFTKVKNGVTKEGIKGRGNTSWNMPKKGYNIKFDSKQSLFGLPKSKKWCIIANYSDKTLLRNKFASILGTEILNASWNPSFVSVDVVMNGEYWGNYIFCEKISIGDGRIEIQDITDVEENLAAGKEKKVTDANGDGVKDLQDGGFILEVDADTRITASDIYVKGNKTNKSFVLKDPDEVSDDIKNHVEAIIKNAETILYGTNFTESENGWRKYIDEDSVIDWYLANEFSKNNDATFYSSVYLYYDPTDEKLHLGPNWDFDIAFGNINYNGCDEAAGFWIKGSAWITRMFQDPAFVEKVKFRWNEKKADLQNAITLSIGTIQNLANQISISADYNFKRWEILGGYVWPNADGYDKRTTYQSEVDYMINWCNERFSWLNAGINEL